MESKFSAMENMVDFRKLYGGVYSQKKVLITGHNGFKGSWLAYWLDKMGAIVYGYALEPNTQPNHFELSGLKIRTLHADIIDQNALSSFLKEIKPDIVFHLAAQALVRESYSNPSYTFEVNVMGVVNLLEIARQIPEIKAIVNVTSDKCYLNREWEWGYRENDSLGGYDPYSASKACSEIVNSAYRNSFFNPANYGTKHNLLLASARAGNVIGGGDWAADRLIPDMVRAASSATTVEIRNPLSTRPWQHVLEPLSGYLTLGMQLLNGDKIFASEWNFGPSSDSNISVQEIAAAGEVHWNKIKVSYSQNKSDWHEAHLLMLDCSRAHKIMNWKPVWGIDKTIKMTIDWYRDYYENSLLLTEEHLIEYVEDAFKLRAIWTM